MDKKTKKEGFDFFLEAYKVVIKPDLDKLATKEDLDNLKNGVYTKMDSVYKEVLNVRVEQSAHDGSHSRIDETLNNLETRVKKLESKTLTV